MSCDTIPGQGYDGRNWDDREGPASVHVVHAPSERLQEARRIAAGAQALEALTAERLDALDNLIDIVAYVERQKMLRTDGQVGRDAKELLTALRAAKVTEGGGAR